MSLDIPNDTPDAREVADMAKEEAGAKAIAEGRMVGGSFDPNGDDGIRVLGPAFAPKSSVDSTDEEVDWPAPINFASLTTEPPPREWIVDEWIAPEIVQGLWGKPGIGKTQLALQLGASVALGVDFLGVTVRQTRVAMFACEDDEQELARRLFRLARAMGRNAAELAGRLTVQARAGKRNELMALKDGKVVPTPLLDRIERTLRDARSQGRPFGMMIFDNLSQMIPLPDERVIVTKAVNLLTKIAMHYGCGILLLGHPAKAEGSEYAGTLAWDAAVRARFLMSEKAGSVALERRKANYAGVGGLKLRSDGECFQRVNPASKEDVEAERQEARAAILRAMKHCTETLKVEPTDAGNSDRCLWKLMEANDLMDRTTVEAVKREVGQMVKDGALIVATRKGRNGKDRRLLTLPAPVAVAA